LLIFTTSKFLSSVRKSEEKRSNGQAANANHIERPSKYNPKDESIDIRRRQVQAVTTHIEQADNLEKSPYTHADEVSAIVIDIGTQTTRSGFAGEETPRSVIPTSYGYIDVQVDGPSASDGNEIDGGDSRVDSGDRPPVTNEDEDHRMKESTPTVVPGKKKHLERRYFMGDRGVDLWRENMEVGSMIKDGISKS
jgi:hypothetical protein